VEIISHIHHEWKNDSVHPTRLQKGFRPANTIEKMSASIQHDRKNYFVHPARLQTLFRLSNTTRL